MFDLGWSEMLVIGVAALVVVGPKELPNLFRTVGVVMGKARGMAREFSKAMEDAADQSGMREIDRTIRAATRPIDFGKTAIRNAALGTGPAAAAATSGGAGVKAPSTPPSAETLPASDAPLALGPETAALAERQAAARQARAARPVAPASPAPPPPADAPATEPAP